MVLIFGGAYQGKKDYAMEAFGLNEGDFFVCGSQGAAPPPGAKGIAGFHQLILGLVHKGDGVSQYIEENLKAWEHSVIVCDDISGGIVPMDPVMRQWREETGRAMVRLASQAAQVHRVYCGIGVRLK